MDHAGWRRVEADPLLRAEYERRIRYDLVAAVAERLEMSVAVDELAVPGEEMADALARADAAMSNQAIVTGSN
ncbi:hypothetical protein ACIPSE_45900 [Streptomyces sp. NPDC090106]|uniref:hypothetical protein n=1 Tax=Streptomyces sp. NPDC090106 TaxID=3365946 RepID=UPI00381240EC